MMFVVGFISFLIHVYSVGYMSHDPSIPRFMSYLSLFTFAMLMLVTSDNLLQLFFGWEGVGLASYLLIGFWYTKPSACAAAIKAFIVNRVGDFGLVLASRPASLPSTASSTTRSSPACRRSRAPRCMPSAATSPRSS